ncbi:MAG: Hsp20/alpha crystallin family protein [Leptonema sp. (in: Bacteria)]|nr:Hsp20/alpha crystallin family protein [Leptonema sp. (in: bacteria)]
MWNTLFQNSLLDELSDFYSNRDVIRQNYPGVQFHEDENGFVVRAEVPGVHPENIDIEIKDDILTLSIEKQPEFENSDDQKSAKSIRSERRQGKYSRSFQLPYHVEADQVKADYRLGVLTIQLPKAEVEKPRKITVT